MNGRPLVAEFIGAFTLSFIGAGSMFADVLSGGQVGLLGVALAHGLALGIMITALGHISGGHFNPAVTFGMLLTRRMTAPQAGAYVASQLAGATAAALLLSAIFAPEVREAINGGVPVPGPTMSSMEVLLAEIVLTFFLVLVVFGTAVDARAPRLGGFAIGLTVTFAILMGGAVGSGALNPSRVFGPALIAGVWDGHWIYWVGPLLGGAIAAFLYQAVFLSDEV